MRYIFNVGEERAERTREHADEGVARCVELMTRGEWRPGASHQAVAEEFGVSPATVKNWATNASRVIRLCLEDDDAREEIRTNLLLTLSRVVDEALARKVTLMPRNRDDSPMEVDSPDLKAAVSAIEVQARLMGLMVQKHDVRTRPAVSHLSRAEHLAELDKLAKEIAEEASRLASEGE